MKRINTKCLLCGKKHEVGIVKENLSIVYKGERFKYTQMSVKCDNDNDEYIPAPIMEQNIANVHNAYYRLKNKPLSEIVWYSFDAENPPPKSMSCNVDYLVAVYSRVSDMTMVFTAYRNDNSFTIAEGGMDIEIYDNDVDADEVVYAYIPLSLISVPDVPDRLKPIQKGEEDE